MVTPGASSSQDTFAHAATPEPEAAPSGGASAVPTWRAEPRWVRLEHLLDPIPEETLPSEKTLASAHGHSFSSASSKAPKRVSFADDAAGAHRHNSSSSTSSWTSPAPPQRPPTFGAVAGDAAFRAAANAISSASEEEAGDARGDDDDVAQYIGLERATFWGPYHWVTDLEEACYYMEQLCFDTSANAQELDSMWEDGWQPSLQMMCRRYLNYELDDTFQTANWHQRPMPEEMLQYAAIEVQVLLPLESAIEREMNRARGYAWEEQIL